MHIDVAIRDSSIKLGQFIKLASLVGTGGEAKELIAQGQVLVNGEADTRRGRTLYPGDVVSVGGASARVAEPQHAAQDPEEEFFDEATADDDFDPGKWR